MTDARAPWRGELRDTLRLAAPIVLTQFVWAGMMITDTAMIGRLGADALAGATLSMSVFFLAWVGLSGLVAATAALAAQAYGARRPRQVRRVVRQGLWVTIATTLPVLIVFRFTPDLMAATGQPEAARPHAAAYMSTLMWSLPPAIAFAVMRNFVAALGRPMPALWVMLAGLVANALLAYGLIFGNFGLPRLELVGAGLATTTANAAMFLALTVVAVRCRPFRRYAILGRFWRPDWRQFRTIFRIGLPIAGAGMLQAGFFIAAVFVIGQFGTTVVAAHMIAMQLPHITFMVPMGLAQAATVRVGHAVGRRDGIGAYRAGWTAYAVALAFMVVPMALALAVPEAIAGLFLDAGRADSAAVLALAVSFLFFAALFQFADGMQAVAFGALRGLNDTAVPMIMVALSYWVVGISAGLGLAFGAGMGGAGIWIGFVVALTCEAVLLTGRFRRLARTAYLPALAVA